MSSINFSKQLIKGKIAELIFEQMFRETKKFTILPFGYEKTIPELAQYNKNVMVRKVEKNIRKAPDYVLLSHDKKQVYLVEVKYQSVLEVNKTKKIVQEILKLWDPSWLFIATPGGFYFSACNAIINKNGRIDPLPDKWVNKAIQEEYLKLLNMFER